MPPDTHNALRGSGVLYEGARLGKYEIVRQLGAGGMGAVYEAVHTQIGKRVAIKVLAPAVAAKPEARTRFLREAQLTSKVRHDHAVDVNDMGTEGDQTFLVMELLDGEDLATRLGREQRLAIADLVDIMLPVCSAVAAAHAAGVIHRDLKPQNIFLARSANGIVPKVLDFGISKVQDAATVDALTGSDAVIGTPYYLAPEQVKDSRNASPASDQYAIGVVLYECMTGELPFRAESLYGVFHAIVAGELTKPRERRPDLDAKLEAVVLRAMDVSPEWRFASVTALAYALYPFASERGRMLWKEAFGSPFPPSQPAAPTPSSHETGLDDSVRTPRWPAARKPGTPSGPSPAPPPPATPVGYPPAAGGITPATPPWHPAAAPALQTDAPARRDRSLFVGGVVMAALAVAGGALWFATRGRLSTDTGEARAVAPAPPPPAPAPAPPPRRYDARVTVEPARARVQLDGAPAGGSPFERTFAADGTSHTLVISADGFEPQTIFFQDAPPPARVVLVALPVAAPARARPHARPSSRRKEAAPAPAPAPAAPRPAAPTTGANNAPVIE